MQCNVTLRYSLRYFPINGVFDKYISNCKLFVCLFWARQPPVVQGPLIHDVSRSNSTTHQSQ
jgi:hypothetical protein